MANANWPMFVSSLNTWDRFPHDNCELEAGDKRQTRQSSQSSRDRHGNKAIGCHRYLTGKSVPEGQQGNQKRPSQIICACDF